MSTLTAEQAFDSIGPAYESAFANLQPQSASLTWLKTQLPPRAKCLDIGCGTGRPVCSDLAAAGHDVLGLDVSGAMIDFARANVPGARFAKVDVRDFRGEEGGWDAVTCFFGMIAGVTQAEIRGNIRRIHGWLRPGGVFVFATVPLVADGEEIEWMGRRVMVSSLGAEETVEWIRGTGFEVLFRDLSTFTPQTAQAGICEDDKKWEEPHLFVYARKPL